MSDGDSEFGQRLMWAWVIQEDFMDKIGLGLGTHFIDELF